jgi:hypothetical protein
MGRSNRLKSAGNNGSSLRSDPLAETAQANDYLEIEDYADYGLLREAISLELSSDQRSPEERRLAQEVVGQVEDIASSKEKILHEADLSKEGLRIAEGIFDDLGDAAGDENFFSEQLDPDGDFLSQSDSDHFYALAAYMRALREKSPVEGHGDGISEARREHYADIVDQARALGKESLV